MRTSLRILCAEDDSQIAFLLKTALESAGHKVEVAVDGLAAFERITVDLDFFDLLVTDHQMPRLMGSGLVAKLRATGYSGKIIVHSSSLHGPDETVYRTHAVDHILTKPVPLPELLEAIEQIGIIRANDELLAQKNRTLAPRA